MKNKKMKLLLVYPQQANRPKKRVSRTGAQLNGIAKSARALLERGTDANLCVSEFAYEKDAHDKALNLDSIQQGLAPVLEDTDLVVDVSPAPNVNVQKSEFAGPVIHLSPTFSGSFACNDITIKGCGRLLQSEVMQSFGDSRQPYLDKLPSTHELDANMHYSAFSPLPTRIGDAFYRSEKDHALVFLSYPDHLRNEATIDTDKQVLSKILHTVEHLRSITFVCERLEDVPLIQRVADELKQALGLNASIWGLRKGEFHDLFSIMAKSSVVLFGGNALFADAIIRGIPVYPWRCNLPGAEHIAQAYRQFSTSRKTDRSVLLRAQRKHLDRLIDAQYLDATLPNHRGCFDEVLSNLINSALPAHVFAVNNATANLPDWVIEPARISPSREMPDRLSRSVWSDRQHLLRFKQPANREIVSDSNRKDRQVFTRIK